MARIFTISFLYNRTEYHSFVTVRTTPLYIEYTFTNLQPEIRFLLPGNTVISPSPRQFLFPDAQPEHSLLLMNILIKALEEHLQSVRS